MSGTKGNEKCQEKYLMRKPQDFCDSLDEALGEKKSKASSLRG